MPKKSTKLSAKKTKKIPVAKPRKLATEKPRKPEVAEPGAILASVIDTKGKNVGKISLPSQLFGAKVNKTLLAQSVRVYLANQRSGNASTKTRGQVEGSTRKIYRQKGTGRARHGAIRAPIFVGGGIVFGPQPRDYHLSLPKKMKREALASALTSQFQEGKIKIVEGLETLEPKTKFMAKTFDAVGVVRPMLLVIASKMPSVIRAARNIEGVDIIAANNLSPFVALSHTTLVFMKQAIPLLKDTFVQKN